MFSEKYFFTIYPLKSARTKDFRKTAFDNPETLLLSLFNNFVFEPLFL